MFMIYSCVLTGLEMVRNIEGFVFVSLGNLSMYLCVWFLLILGSSQELRIIVILVLAGGVGIDVEKGSIILGNMVFQ